MDVKHAAQVIRDTVTMDQILDLYGYQPKRGFMVCPFHGDHDASLKVYKGTRGWHCFGCGRGGSVIDFVMEHEGCDFKTAVRAICAHIHLGLYDQYENPYIAEDNLEMQRRFDSFAESIYSFIDAQKIIIELRIQQDLSRMKDLEKLRKMEPPQLTAADYDFMNQWKEISQYNEYLLEDLEEYREKVAEWRRKARRIKV